MTTFSLRSPDLGPPWRERHAGKPIAQPRPRFRGLPQGSADHLQQKGVIGEVFVPRWWWGEGGQATWGSGSKPMTPRGLAQSHWVTWRQHSVTGPHRATSTDSLSKESALLFCGPARNNSWRREEKRDTVSRLFLSSPTPGHTTPSILFKTDLSFSALSGR